MDIQVALIDDKNIENIEKNNVNQEVLQVVLMNEEKDHVIEEDLLIVRMKRRRKRITIIF